MGILPNFHTEKSVTLYRAAGMTPTQLGPESTAKELLHSEPLLARASRKASCRAGWGPASDANVLAKSSPRDWQRRLTFRKSWKQRTGAGGLRLEDVWVSGGSFAGDREERQLLTYQPMGLLRDLKGPG